MRQYDTGGDVGTNGNLTINGSVDVNGNLSTPRTGVGNCTTGNVTACTGCSVTYAAGLDSSPAATRPAADAADAADVAVDDRGTLGSRATTTCTTLGLTGSELQREWQRHHAQEHHRRRQLGLPSSTLGRHASC